MSDLTDTRTQHRLKAQGSAAPYWHWAECECGEAFAGADAAEAIDKWNRHVAIEQKGTAP